MSSRFRTAALAALLAMPFSASSFMLPSAQRARVGISLIGGSNNEGIVPSINSSARSSVNLDELEVTTSLEGILSPPSSSYGLADVEENIPTDLTIGALEDETTSAWVEENTVSLDDIIRDLDGIPLSKEYFAEKMGISTENIDSYTCPEQDVFRGFMSNACRVRLLPGGETAFYKSIVFEELDHAQEKLKNSPHKLARDVQSYKVVADFLSSKACEEVTKKAGVHIPKCYDAQARPDHSDPMKSKFSFLFADYAPWNGWYQQWLLQEDEECKAALTTLAKIHAFFWNGSTFWDDADAAAELEASIWESGSYVQPKAQGFHQYKEVAKEWETKRLKFEKELSPFDYWDNLGERLQSVAKECGYQAHPFANEELTESYRKYRTFTHGDPKQANLFFRKKTSSDSKDVDDDEPELEVGVIDFQWSGFGLAATDVAHFLMAAIHADRLVDGGEEAYLRYYYDELQRYLVEFGVCSTEDDAIRHLSYDTFMEQYDTAFLDKCRLVIAYTWARFTEPVEKDDEVGCARTMNKTSYNKSIPNVVWLASRCDEILKSRGV